jgi:pentatricopeptide repeat protein
MLHLMQTPAWGSVQPNAYTYSALLKSLGEYGQWQLAEQVFSQLEAELLGRPSPTSPAGSAASAASAASGASRPLLDLAALASSIPNWQSNLQLLAAPMMSGAGLGSVTPAAVAAVAAAAAAAAAGQEQQQQLQQLQQQQRSWTSPSQLNGLDLGLQQQQQLQEQMSGGGGGGFSLFSSSGFLKRPSGGAQAPVGTPQAGAAALARAASGGGGDGSFSMVNDPVVALGSEAVAHQLSQLSLAQQQQLLAASAAAEAAAPAAARQPAPPRQHPAGLAPLPPRGGAAAQSKARPGEARGLVNEVVCGALMLAYERAGMWEQAVGVLARARQLGLSPNTVMFNTAISAAGKAGQLDVAVALFGEVPEPDAVSFETMIAAYGMCGWQSGPAPAARLVPVPAACCCLAPAAACCLLVEPASCGSRAGTDARPPASLPPARRRLRGQGRGGAARDARQGLPPARLRLLRPHRRLQPVGRLGLGAGRARPHGGGRRAGARAAPPLPPARAAAPAAARAAAACRWAPRPAHAACPPDLPACLLSARRPRCTRTTRWWRRASAPASTTARWSCCAR